MFGFRCLVGLRWGLIGCFVFLLNGIYIILGLFSLIWWSFGGSLLNEFILIFFRFGSFIVSLYSIEFGFIYSCLCEMYDWLELVFWNCFLLFEYFLLVGKGEYFVDFLFDMIFELFDDCWSNVLLDFIFFGWCFFLFLGGIIFVLLEDW